MEPQIMVSCNKPLQWFIATHLQRHGKRCPHIPSFNYTDEVTYSGSVIASSQGQSSQDCDKVLEDLKQVYIESLRSNVTNRASSTSTMVEQISFPTISPKASYEYNGLPIFSNAYPWLFPGGVGDLDHVNINIKGYMTLWLRTMILYYDGRFCKDPTFYFMR